MERKGFKGVIVFIIRKFKYLNKKIFYSKHPWVVNGSECDDLIMFHLKNIEHSLDLIEKLFDRRLRF